MVHVIPSKYGSFNTGATVYLALSDDGYSSTTEADAQQVISSNGTISALRMNISAAAGGGKTWTFTLRVNGSDTALTCAITGASDTTGSDLTHTVSVSAGDLVSISCVPSGTPASAQGYGTVSYTGGTANESLIPWCSRNIQFATSGTEYAPVVGTMLSVATDATEVNASTVVPTGGVIKKLYVKLRAAPGVGKSRTFTLMLNGSAQALAVTISDAATTGNDTSNSITIAAGDLVSIRSTSSGTPAASGANFGMIFTATTDGEALLMGIAGARSPGVPVTEYSYLSGTSSPQTSDSGLYQLASACTLKKFYVSLLSAPGVGATFVWTPRVNSADPASPPTVTISGNATTTGNDTSNTTAVAAGDLIGYQTTMAVAITISQQRIGMVIVATGAGPANVKTVNGLAAASVKVVDGLAYASIKSIDGLV